MSDQVVPIENVAKYVILRCQQQGWKITPKALQKVLYYVQAYSLYGGEDNAIAREVGWDKGASIFKETPEAWIHGAVYRQIYNLYRQYGYQDLAKVVGGIDPSEADKLIIDTRTRGMIDAVLKKCSEKHKMDADKLEELNHKEKAWINARGDSKRFEPTYNRIEIDDMRLNAPKLT